MSNKFDTVSQGTKTIQEVLNDLNKYAMWMIHLPKWLRRHPIIFLGCGAMENTHTAASNTKPAAYKAQPLVGQTRTIIGRENIVHHVQNNAHIHAPRPE